MLVIFSRGMLAIAAVACSPAIAAPPAVVADIPPVHSIAARIMEGIAEPALLMPPGSSPHHYALRPSEARGLQDADLVIWVGPELTTWLAEPVEILAREAAVITAMGLEGMRLRSFSEPHHHDHDHPDHQNGDDEHAHALGASDPHIWLDPDNALVLAGEIAQSLGDLDPEHADRYRSNLAEFEIEWAKLVADLEARLQPVRDSRYIVFHDAYGYFEDRFGLRHSGAISLGDAEQPGVAHIREISERIREDDIVCIFTEPQFSPRLAETVLDGTDARKGTLDPLGAGLEPGAALYSNLLTNLGRDFATCLAPPE